MKELILLISFIMIGSNLFGIDEKTDIKDKEGPKDFIIIP